MHAIIYLIFNLLRSDRSGAEQDNKEQPEAMKVVPNQPQTSGLRQKEEKPIRPTWLLCGLDGSYDGT